MECLSQRRTHKINQTDLSIKSVAMRSLTDAHSSRCTVLLPALMTQWIFAHQDELKQKRAMPMSLLALSKVPGDNDSILHKAKPAK